MRSDERGYRLFMEHVVAKAKRMKLARLSPTLRMARLAADRAAERTAERGEAA